MKLGLACVALPITTALLLGFASRAEAQSPTSTVAPSLPPPPSAEPAPPPPPAQQSSVRMTLEATQQVDHPQAPAPVKKSPDDSTVLHGFRLGYGYVMNYD